MKKLNFIGVLLVFITLSCSKMHGTSNCIKTHATDFCHNQSCDNGVQVDQYKFQNEMVYVFESGDCGADMTSEVMDAECNSLGDLGGMSGNTMINGEDFSHATFVKTIQKK